MQEIEEKAFVLSIGVDKANDGEGEDKAKYKVTIVSPDTAKSEEGKVLDFAVLSAEGQSYNSSIVKLLQEFSKNFNYEHTKAIFFGEDLLKDEFLVKSIFDTFSRDRQFHSSMLVFMVPDPGKAEDIFKVRPKMKSLLAFYVTEIADHELESSRIGKITFLDFTRLLAATKGCVVIPIIIAKGDDVRVEGMGIIKNYKLIGKLDEEETIAYRWCDNRAKGGVIDPPTADGINAPLIYRNFKRSIKLESMEDDIVTLKYKMKTEGAIEEYILGKKLMNGEKIKDLEKNMEEYMEAQCYDLIKKLQEDYKVDLIGVRDYLSKFHPKLYNSVSEDFEDFFQNRLEIKVEVSIKIRRIGKTV